MLKLIVVSAHTNGIQVTCASCKQEKAMIVMFGE